MPGSCSILDGCSGSLEPLQTGQNFIYDSYEVGNKDSDVDMLLRSNTCGSRESNALMPSPSVKPTWKTASENKNFKITKGDNKNRSKKPSSSRAKSFNSDSSISLSPLSANRISHNLTEKRYRRRLNRQFELLLSALPVNLVADYSGSVISGSGEQKISKSEVLVLAKDYIESLEKKKEGLESRNRMLMND